VGPSQLPLNILREDEELILHRGEHSSRPGSASVLLLAPSSSKPAMRTLKKLEHEYSLRNELDSAWAARPLAVKRLGQPAFLREDPGSEPQTGSSQNLWNPPRFCGSPLVSRAH
jgi:hypothetical protein